MTVSRERFEQGLSYDAYKAQMTKNQERFLENERTLELDAEDVAFFRALPEPLNVLVLAEDWCGDVINNLPVLGRLAEASGKLTLRIFLRDQNLDIMDQYLKDGQFRSIPVFVFFDSKFNELGHFIERPARITQLIQEMRNDLFANDPVLSAFPQTLSPSELPEDARLRLSQAYAEFSAKNRALAVKEVVREVQNVVNKTPSFVTIPVAAASNGNKPSWQRPAQERTEGPVKVSITYCAACGYEPQTLELASALMGELRDNLSSIELIPWHDGMFDVVVDGELIHSMSRDGGFPESATIINAVRSRLGTPTKQLA